jgi:glycosyltransferase involved in cell wall biosynthesis
MTRFSVVIPCYNEEKYLPEALASLRAQSFAGDVELIIVDNNCTDGTATIARAAGARVVSESHRGVCNARQAGTLASTGEIVVSTDADTTFDPDWLARIDAAFRADPDAVAVVGPCRYVTGPWWGRRYAQALFGAVNAVHRVTGKPYYVSATNIAFRRDRWPGYDVTMTQGGDELDLLRKLRRSGRVVYLHRNPTLTSGRRLTRGFFYNMVVTLMVHYLLTYHLNRLTHRRLLGSAPAFRTDEPVRRVRVAPAFAAAACAAVIAASFATPRHYVADRSRHMIEFVTDRIDPDAKP